MYINKMKINLHYCLGGSLAALLATIYCYPSFFYIFLFLVYSLFLILGAIAGTIFIHFNLTSKTQPKLIHQPYSVVYNATKSSIFDLPKPIQNPSNLPLIFGKTVDLQLQQIIEYVLRDFMSPWLGHVATKPKLINDVLREDLWNAVQKIRERAIKVDAAKVIAVDMVNRVTVHLEKIRIAEARAYETSSTPVFSTNSYLQDVDHEMQFLRKLSEIMVILLLPRGYSLPPLKILLTEILSFKIFFPMINMLTSPDYINQKVVQNIESRLAAAAINKRSYEYAASFEDFVKIINNSGNMEELSIIRTSIVNDLMHATTMQNLQRAKGLDPDSDEKCLSRAELTTAVRLKRYVQQLSFAKAQCEKNLLKFGWKGNYSNDMNLTLTDILNTSVGRRYLTIFLEPLKASALVGFYLAVEDMKHAPKSQWHNMGTEIFYTYIRVPKPEIKIEKSDRKLIETFLLGDAGPDIFYQIQSNVVKTLEDKYFPPFLLSEQYLQLKDALNSEDFKDPTLNSLSDGQEEHNTSAETENQMDVATHTTYARKKLEQIQERLDKKSLALDALKYSVKPESKVLIILEKEMEWLRNEKRQTEAHLRRTDAWSVLATLITASTSGCNLATRNKNLSLLEVTASLLHVGTNSYQQSDHIGKWKATIQSLEVSDEKESMQFMVLVHVDEDINNPTNYCKDQKPSNISSGWVVLRSITQFHELHRKLRPMCNELKSIDLPTNFKLFFLKNDKNSLEKIRAQVQKYLNFILEDDHLCGSEAIYTFLSPSSDHLKQTTPSPRKTKFSLSTLFKSDSAKAENNKPSDPFWGLTHHREDDDISMYLEGSESDSKLQLDLDSKDSIAEPLYALMGEIFDMGGVFKWLRKSIISFVQITYGRTINRQIRESVAYLFEESMLHHYYSAILKSFWPGGVLASSYPLRSEDTIEMTRNAAKALLMDNIPEVLSNLVGAQAAKHGVLKVFDALQNPIYNKQLFYELVEILMIELFPEIRQLKVTAAAKGNNSK